MYITYLLYLLIYFTYLLYLLMYFTYLLYLLMYFTYLLYLLMYITYLLYLLMYITYLLYLLMYFTYLLYLLTYLLTPCSKVLFEKLTCSQLVKKFPAFYGTQMFITIFTSARHLFLSWAYSIQSMPPHPTTWRSILILSSYLRLGLPSGLFPSGFTTKTLHTPLFYPYVLHALHRCCYENYFFSKQCLQTRNKGSVICNYAGFKCHYELCFRKLT